MSFSFYQKKSRDESKGHGSGVEIIVNEPYENGPGGNGQYTRKIYHVGSHLPGWIKGLLPKSALTVEEEAWNAYPYTKTRYTCPFVEKFSLEIETYYFPDDGNQENVFKLSGGDLRNRIVDVIDIVKDQLYGADYVRDEDPTLFVSNKTSRGPLDESWLEDYWMEVKGKTQPTANNKSLMCAYKLCRVEFRYWGMQTKLEKFIHDTALRKTMVRAHRQAWAWQDEWYGLTMDDIREIEKQTMLALQKKMGGDDGSYGEEEGKIVNLYVTKFCLHTNSSDYVIINDCFSFLPFCTRNCFKNSLILFISHWNRKFCLSDDVLTVEILEHSESASRQSNQFNSIEKTEENSTPQVMHKRQPIPMVNETAASVDVSSDEEEIVKEKQQVVGPKKNSVTLLNSAKIHRGSKGALPSPLGSASSFDLQVCNWRMEKLEVDSKSGSEEEFYDCLGKSQLSLLYKLYSHTFFNGCMRGEILVLKSQGILLVELT